MTYKYIVSIGIISFLICWMGGNLLTFGIVMLIVGVFLMKCWQSGKNTIKNRVKWEFEP